jgi:hypothetical protein
MPHKSAIKVINIEQVSAKVLQLHFNVEWTMDDINAVSEHILLSLSAQKLEVVQGADLYCLRLKYRTYELLLNFEEYSHACWLECLTEQDILGLQAVKEVLS